MNHDKIIDRIRKLLNMAGDTSSPNEAAIAANRARKLMDQYQINEMDLNTVEGIEFGTNDFELGRKTTGRMEGILAVAVANLNDTQAKWHKANGYYSLRFEGMLVDTVCAVEMYRWLISEAHKQAQKNEQGRADRHAYRLGFASGVSAQVREIMKEREQLQTKATASHAGTSLVVCKMAMVHQHFKPVKYGNSRATFTGGRDAYGNGKAAGQRMNLNRQVSGQGQRRIA